jgi:hypothetical protein
MDDSDEDEEDRKEVAVKEEKVAVAGITRLAETERASSQDSKEKAKSPTKAKVRGKRVKITVFMRTQAVLPDSLDQFPPRNTVGKYHSQLFLQYQIEQKNVIMLKMLPIVSLTYLQASIL